MKKMFIFIGAAAAAAGFISMAPPASAGGWKDDPGFDACAQLPPNQQMDCAFRVEQDRRPDLGNRGTGDPAHNICQITGHDC